MKLQSDATTMYHFDREGSTGKIVRKKDRQANTPHNTYRITGLPPGPIANPGIDSLRAALYPAKVDYLFFSLKNKKMTFR